LDRALRQICHHVRLSVEDVSGRCGCRVRLSKRSPTRSELSTAHVWSWHRWVDSAGEGPSAWEPEWVSRVELFALIRRDARVEGSRSERWLIGMGCIAGQCVRRCVRRCRRREGAGPARPSRQATYKSFLSELLYIECEDREVRRKARLVKQAVSLARKASRTSTSPRTRTSRPHWSTPSPRVPGSAPGSRSA
jgi:hypothetical protein